MGCECSGVVRNAFELRGWDAWSCDILPALDGGKHIQGDLLDVIEQGGWDMLIAHPPCTYLSYAGARWNYRTGRTDEQQKAILFFYLLLHCPIDRIALENPRGLAAKLIRKPDDIIEPYEFGHHVSKRTYLWLKNLPPLMKTHIDLEFARGWTEDRHGFSRSITFSGIAEAMAAQWSGI